MLYPGIALGILFLVLFLWLVKVHLKRDLKHKQLEELLRVNKLELKALKHDYSSFDPGDEFTDTRHPFSYDMDMFGKGSVFQYLNRTSTLEGKKVLAGFLSNEELDPELISGRQNAVKELALMPKIMQEFRASGRINSEDPGDNETLLNWIKIPEYYGKKPFMLILANILPAITLSALVISIFIPSLVGLGIGLFLLQLFIIGSRLRHTSQHHQMIGKRLEILNKYHALVSVIEKGNYAGKELTRLAGILYSGEASATRSIAELTKIVKAFDSRLNMLAAVFLEGLLLWDIQCMIRLERWKRKQGSHMKEWIDAIATFDALASMSVFAFNHPTYSWPEFSTDPGLNTKGLGHMLIPAEERVCNDFQISSEGEFIIITGANMAGKSTFLRTVVTNMILAMAGCPVCATEFRFRPMALFSSMRTSDSLNKHESYFYAELRRLKELLDRLHKGEKLFVILDEILKGTNSKDKQKGSRAALTQIIELGGTGIIATHDLELAAIEKEFPEKVNNQCFEIEIDKASISFDYKLLPGITTKMNALLLMEQMGIIRST